MSKKIEVCDIKVGQRVRIINGKKRNDGVFMGYDETSNYPYGVRCDGQQFGEPFKREELEIIE